MWSTEVDDANIYLISLWYQLQYLYDTDETTVIVLSSNRRVNFHLYDFSDEVPKLSIYFFQLFTIQKGGNPNNSGLNASNVLRINVAGFRASFDKCLSGVMTHCIPAANAAVIPWIESSNARHSDAFGDFGNFEQAKRYISGSGFPLVTSSSVVMWLNASINRPTWRSFRLMEFLGEFVAIAIGILFSLKCSINRRAPGINSTFSNERRAILLNSWRNSSIDAEIWSSSMIICNACSVECPRSLALSSDV